MNGWAGTILRVDLTRRQVRKEPLPDRLRREYLGGRGFAIRLLYDEVPPGADPLGPENKLIFSIGPLNGTPIGMGRMTVTTKSPETGFYMEGNSGGFFAPELKWAGYDMIVLEGQADRPVYLWIRDGDVEIRDASHLWGKTISQTEQALREELGDPEIKTRYIGPAGENLSNLSIVMGEMAHAGGRGGVAAVMGAKRLKAIAVRGSGGVRVARPKAFEEAYETVRREVDYRTTRDPYVRPWHIYGTMFIPKMVNDMGGFMSRNAQEGLFDGIARFRAEELMRQYVVKGRTCFACPTASCGHFLEVKEGPHAGLRGEGIQAGLMISMGSSVGVDDPAWLIHINNVTNELGLDYMSFGTVAAWAMEAYEKGLLTRADTDGLELRFGNAAAVEALARKISYREGFGAVLADGVKRAAERVGRGTEAFALHVKGLDMTTIEPRALFHMGLVYAVNDVGAEHPRVHVPYPPVLSLVPEAVINRLPFDPAKAFVRQSPEQKGALVKWLFDTRAVLNSLETCVFMNRGRVYVDFEPYAQALSTATGEEFGPDDLYTIGERIVNLERAFNVREGASRKDDTLPSRFLMEPLPAGGSAGVVVPLEQMLDEYYAARGWDPETGRPRAATLSRLGLEDVARAIGAVA